MTDIVMGNEPKTMLFEMEEPESNAVVATTNSSALPQAATTVSIRLWHLINLLSLDAVTVGLTWQLVFTLQFFDRFPSLVESSIIGISIWLAYTADRILDSRRLQCELPHSSRHSFHRQFQTLICFLWILALGLNVILITGFTSADQIKWGMVCLLLVFLYLLNAQKNNSTLRRIPKELQAGLIFGFGVSLVCWPAAAQPITSPLLASTLVTGSLFSINCATVAYWERRLDTAQTFLAWTSQRNTTLAPIAYALALEFALILVMLYSGLLPTFISYCLLSSTSCLAITIFSNKRYEQNQTRDRGTPSAQSPKGRELLADLSLILPPATLIVWRVYHGELPTCVITPIMAMTN